MPIAHDRGTSKKESRNNSEEGTVSRLFPLRMFFIFLYQNLTN